MRKNTEKQKKLYDFFKKLDRTFFIDNEYKVYAHLDNALPIGHGQTISQPSLVYSMTLRLELDQELKVLEIGTGSGYQTALLAEFAGEVYTVELIEDLSLKAKQRLEALGYKNVFYKTGDGSKGWADYQPYDRIIATAAAAKVPDPLIEQLKPGGKMIIPIGSRRMQNIMIINKDKNGKVITKKLEPVLFVELKGEYGWDY
ncbi:MAG TPA: protein-L-isoaspartate(D-aspartate) O-methyltransferase [Clostridiaceae bacterium]|jgi:protein-L-isoaspartate(D-aspartate) O-methyltransferase|nr:protein-L-isoaspartate(D-aspartate) O-methyltransferase [Clostridiaceae bacterium]